MEKSDLIFTIDYNLNPDQFLAGERNLEHFCVDVIELQIKIRPHLYDELLEEGKYIFIYGSSRIVEGKRRNGYVIVDGQSRNLLEAGSLPKTWSAQTWELHALRQALHLLEGQKGTIYTDSKYACGVVHTFGKIWLERGLITAKGKSWGMKN